MPISRDSAWPWAQVRFIELMPIGPAAKDHRKLLVPSSEVLARLAEQFDVGPLPYSPGSSSRDYRLVDGEGREGSPA